MANGLRSTPATAGSWCERLGGGACREEFPTQVRTCFASTPIMEDWEGRCASAGDVTRSSSREMGVATDSVARDVVVVLNPPAD